MERYADKYGTQLAKRAGYDWRGALYLQEILKRELRSSWTDSCPLWVKRTVNLLSSHPSCKDRQAAIYKEFFSPIV